MTATVQEQEFWMHVYVASMRYVLSDSTVHAQKADEAVHEFRTRTSLKLPEGDKQKPA